MNQQPEGTVASGTPSLDATDPFLEEAPSPIAGSVHPNNPPQHFKKNWKHWIPPILVFIALMIIAGISFCPTLLSNPKPIGDPTINNTPFGNLPFNESGPFPLFAIQGKISQFDWLKPNTVSVRWHLRPWSPIDPNTVIDIYFDRTPQPVFSFVYNPNSSIPITFDVEHTVEPYTPAYRAPSDLYSFTEILFAVDRARNGGIPIAVVGIFNLGPGDFATKSDVRFLHHNITHVAENGLASVAHSVELTIAITRSVRARALTYSMFAINWILTLASMVTTSIIFSHRGRVPDGFAILPITTILGIPAIRNLYVGSPPFGIYLDVVGFFPQMLTVVACTIVLLSCFAMQSIRGRDVIHGEESVIRGEEGVIRGEEGVIRGEEGVIRGEEGVIRGEEGVIYGKEGV